MVQEPPGPAGPSGIYLHIPFCSRRCTYCDFATEAGRDDRIESYLEALHREIRLFQAGLPGPVDTIFIGGGTPSRLSGEQIRRLLETVRSCFELSPGTEITLESNPEDLSEDRLHGFLEAGVNRLTIGIQSLNPQVLRSVGRNHDGEQALAALHTALKAGFPQVGADLIAGLPGEDPAGWKETLEQVAAGSPHHISVYLLEMDKDTPMTRGFRDGGTVPPEEDRLADDWERTVDTLEALGYAQYEISNFARKDPGGRTLWTCRHNLKYWMDRYYAGFGLGAHGYLEGERRANIRNLDLYLHRLEAGEDPLKTVDPWNPARRLEEALFMGLRRNEGIDPVWMGRRYGIDLETAFGDTWEKAERNRLLERASGRMKLTRAGMLQSNAVFADLLGRLDSGET